MKVNVKIKKLDENAVIPTYGSEYSAGADLYYVGNEPLTVEAGQTVLVHTGVAMEIPEGLVGLIFARSGLATKRSLAPANKVGVIDSDYRGEIMVALHNHSDKPQTVEAKERVAQIAFVPYVAAAFEVADELGDTERGTGGFGSTGRK
jgi:dUTP pyrophosphatase